MDRSGLKLCKKNGFALQSMVVWVLLVLLLASVERFVVSCMSADPGGARATLQLSPSFEIE